MPSMLLERLKKVWVVAASRMLLAAPRRTMPIRDRKMKEKTISVRNAVPTVSGVVAPLMIRRGRWTLLAGAVVPGLAGIRPDDCLPGRVGVGGNPVLPPRASTAWRLCTSLPS